MMSRVSRLTEPRLEALYTADDFGGAKTLRAKVIRELIDEIRVLRAERHSDRDRDSQAAGEGPP